MSNEEEAISTFGGTVASQSRLGSADVQRSSAVLTQGLESDYSWQITG